MFKSQDYMQVSINSLKNKRKMNYFFSPFTAFNYFQPLLLSSYQFPFQIINFVGQMNYFYHYKSVNDNFLSVHQLTESSQPHQLEKRLHQKNEENQEENSKLNFSTSKEPKDCQKQSNRSRNIHSNILKRFFKQLCQSRSMDSFIHKNCNQTLGELGMQLIIEKIKDFFISNKKNYFSPKSIRHTLNSLQNCDKIRNIFTACLYKFLREWFIQILLFSPRIKRNSKLLQMKKSRQLQKFFKSERLYEQKYKINQNQKQWMKKNI